MSKQGITGRHSRLAQSAKLIVAHVSYAPAKEGAER